jgi:hypothetical protein
VLTGEVPLVLRAGIYLYATAALCGAVVLVVQAPRTPSRLAAVRSRCRHSKLAAGRNSMADCTFPNFGCVRRSDTVRSIIKAIGGVLAIAYCTSQTFLAREIMRRFEVGEGLHEVT